MFNWNFCFKGVDGKFFFGGFCGLNSFYFDKIVQDIVYFLVVIIDIKVYNVLVCIYFFFVREGIVVNRVIDFIDKIVLGYWENNFSFDFLILNYINFELNCYLYWLEGYDKEWLFVEVGCWFVYYNNFLVGIYIFCVKGVNQNGIWFLDMKCLCIIIFLLFWLLWWVYCFYVLLFVLLVWYIYWIVRNCIWMKQVIEMGKIEWQKMEEINYVKLQFFINIIYELLILFFIILVLVDELK